MHHLLAIYDLGAPGAVIDAAYQAIHLDHMRIAFVAPDKVKLTDDNFTDYLGNNQCCTPLSLCVDGDDPAITTPTSTISTALCLNQVQPSLRRSYASTGAEQPQLLNRFFEVLVHPVIHVGYCAEFGIMGLIAEARRLSVGYRRERRIRGCGDYQEFQGDALHVFQWSS